SQRIAARAVADRVDRGPERYRIDACTHVVGYRGSAGSAAGSGVPAARRAAQRLRQELRDDARIAAIARVHGASVWTSNVADYARVPGLSVSGPRPGQGSRRPVP